MTEGKLSKEEQIKEEIINAAQRLFQKYGLNKTTMEDIAKAAGKGKSTLYYYYASKDDVFEAVAVKEINETISEVSKTVEVYTSATEKIKQYVNATFRSLHNKYILYNIVCGEMKNNLDQILRKQRDIFDFKEINLVKDILIKGLENGEFDGFSEKNAEMLARTLVSGLRGIEIDLFYENKLNDWIEGMDLICNILLQGLQRK
jgi:AcrR family transcriptional regulator